MAPLVIERTFFLPYLPFSLLQNARSNPHRLLSLLGDKSNRIDWDKVQQAAWQRTGIPVNVTKKPQLAENN